MLIAEPTPTPYDVRFNVGPIPVRVDPWFWVVTALLGFGSMDKPNRAIDLLIWVLVAFISILVHELGHATAALACGWRPRVVLYMMGGLAIFRPTYHHPWRNVGVLLAGPGAGFLLAGVVLINLAIFGFIPSFQFREWQQGDGTPIFSESLFSISVSKAFESRHVWRFVFDMMWVNIFWGVLNLMPLYPLDGGQIAREVLTAANRRDGLRQSLQLSVLTGGLLAALGLSMGSAYMVIFFALLAFQSWQTLQQLTMGGGGRGGWQ